MKKTNRKIRKNSSTDEELPTIEEVLRKNRQLQFLNEIESLAVGAEDDPPLIFGWENIHVFVNAINTTILPAHINPPFPIPVPLTVENFKVALLEYLRAPGSQLRIGTIALPCTLEEYSYPIALASRLLDDPWFNHMTRVCPQGLPIARVYVLHPRTVTLSDALGPSTLNSIPLWG